MTLCPLILDASHSIGDIVVKICNEDADGFYSIGKEYTVSTLHLEDDVSLDQQQGLTSLSKTVFPVQLTILKYQ